MGGCNANGENFAFAAMRGKLMAAAIQAQEVMQLLPCAGKPVAVAI